jgi:hypothetical protein
MFQSCSASSIASSTPLRFSYSSLFSNRITLKPSPSKYFVLYASYSSIVIEKCLSPSSSITKPTFRTIEVDNVATYTDLSSEFLPEELATFEVLPEDSFRCRQ